MICGVEEIVLVYCLPKNSKGDLTFPVGLYGVTLGLKSIISLAYDLPLTIRSLSYRSASNEFTVTKSPSSFGSII